jgi:hypothetical protein
VQRKLAEPNPHDVRIGHRTDPIFGKQRYRARSGLALLKDLDGLAPSLLLAVVDLAQIKRGPLNHSSAGDTAVFHQAVVAMLLAVFLSRRVAQKHNGIALCTLSAGWE